MPCSYPITAYKTAGGAVVFSDARTDTVATLQLPCGQCTRCRLERSRQWAIRIMHEAQLHEQNCFITLTYNEENLPKDNSLHYKHFQDFMKRLRRRFSTYEIRFYMCGEYGETHGRAHYHACLFGIGFPDKTKWIKSKKGSQLYRSKTLESLWRFGNSDIGELNMESAAYAARYIMKKQTGEEGKTAYAVVDLNTGEIRQRTPEFNKMSLKPGIGANWLKLYWPQIARNGKTIVNGKEVNIPKYYTKYLKNTEKGENIQYQNYLNGKENYQDNTPERLAVKEQVAKARVNTLSRE